MYNEILANDHHLSMVIDPAEEQKYEHIGYSELVITAINITYTNVYAR